MVPTSLHVAGIAFVVATTVFAASFGQGWQVAAAYGLAVALGVALYRQAAERVVRSAWGNLVVGFLLGFGASLALGTALTEWYVDLPVDLVLWQLGLLTWDTWLGIGGVVLATMFVMGLFDAVR